MCAKWFGSVRLLFRWKTPYRMTSGVACVDFVINAKYYFMHAQLHTVAVQACAIFVWLLQFVRSGFCSFENLFHYFVVVIIKIIITISKTKWTIRVRSECIRYWNPRDVCSSLSFHFHSFFFLSFLSLPLVSIFFFFSSKLTRSKHSFKWIYW